jgi:hypothetical protein
MKKLSKVSKIVGLGIILFNFFALDYVNLHSHDNDFFNAIFPNICNLMYFELVPIGIIFMLVGEVLGLFKK